MLNAPPKKEHDPVEAARIHARAEITINEMALNICRLQEENLRLRLDLAVTKAGLGRKEGMDAPGN